MEIKMEMSKESLLRMQRMARIAHSGEYECFRCRKIDKQENGLVVAFGGGILLAMCPECMDAGPVMIRREGGYIRVTMPRPTDNLVVQASQIPDAGLAVANPDVTKVEL
jgi:hypothetical protein